MIMDFLKKVPAGMMIVPMFISAIFNTLSLSIFIEKSLISILFILPLIYKNSGTFHRTADD